MMGWRNDSTRALQSALLEQRRAAPTARLVGGTSSRWRVDLRVPRDQLQRLGLAGLERIPGITVNEYPPASGPEAEVTIPIDASRAEIAERVGRRIIARLGLQVLAARARR